MCLKHWDYGMSVPQSCVHVWMSMRLRSLESQQIQHLPSIQGMFSKIPQNRWKLVQSSNPINRKKSILNIWYKICRLSSSLSPPSCTCNICLNITAQKAYNGRGASQMIKNVNNFRPLPAIKELAMPQLHLWRCFAPMQKNHQNFQTLWSWLISLFGKVMSASQECRCLNLMQIKHLQH